MFTIKNLLIRSDKGLYCPDGEFYMDPTRKVDVAVISHAHSDHARRGHGIYHCSRTCEPLLKVRLGKKINVISHEWGEVFNINGVNVSLHPAGHVLGSAQIKIEKDGISAVFSGDYKREPDNSCEPYTPVKCDHFITEATFALPVYQWQSSEKILQQIANWIHANKKNGKHSIIWAYSLGKAQRLLCNLKNYHISEAWVHPGIEEMNKCYRSHGIDLMKTHMVTDWEETNTNDAQFFILPPGSSESLLSQLGSFEQANVSGWSTIKKMQQWNGKGIGFPLSDHADWNELIQSVRQSEAKSVWVVHGQNRVFARFLTETMGIQATAWEDLPVMKTES